MRKIIPLIFSVFSTISLSGQANGGWGTCEFTTVAAMNAFDPSGSNYSCKTVFVQATNDHYQWDGAAWVQVTAGENIYTTDNTLLGHRVVTLANYNLHWNMTGTGDFEVLDNGTVAFTVKDNGRVGIGNVTPLAPLHIYETTGTSAGTAQGSVLLEHGNSGGTSSIVFRSAVNSTSDYAYIQYSDDASGNGSTNENGLLAIGIQNDVDGNVYQDDIAIMPSGSLGIGTTSPDAFLDVEGGNVRLSNYGDGTYDTGNETYILGVETDGDVVEIDPVTLGGSNIYNTNGTLTGNRTVTFGANNLALDLTSTGDFNVLDNGTTAFSVKDNGLVGIGNVTPNGPLHIYESTGTSPSDDDGTIILEHGNSGGESSIVFKSNVNSGSDYGYISYSDNGSGNGSSNQNSLLTIGVENNASGDSNVDDIAILPSGSLGVGTIAPQAKLDVDGGSVRFSDYGNGTYLDEATQFTPAAATYTLAVDTNGDIVEVNTAKSSRIFYPPALVIDVSSTGNDRTLDLHAQYVSLYGTPAVASSGAPAAIPTYAQDELFYYVTDYDTDVFSDLSISADGILTYDVDTVPTDNCAVFNVVFVVK